MKKSLVLFIFTALAFSSLYGEKFTKELPIVENFDSTKYLGTWYEIARYDFRFEKNMDNTTANYSMMKNGHIRVINRGYDYVSKKWKESKGQAKFRGANTVGALEVSFFGPFYADYNIIALDDNYQYALVAGKDTNYLWFLSRTTTMPDDVKNQYVELAKSLGYDTDKLVWVNQTK